MSMMDDIFSGDAILVPAVVVKEASRVVEWTAQVSPGDDLLDIEAVQLAAPHIKMLAPYVRVARNLQEANEGTGPIILSTLSEGLIKTGTFLAAAKAAYSKAYTERKRQQGIAALEGFEAYCKEKGIKGSVDQRSAFVDICPAVLQAAEHEAMCEAMVVQLDTIKQTLFMAISSAKSIVYGYRDSSSVTGNRV